MYDGLSEQSRRRIQEGLAQMIEERTSEAVQEIIQFDKTPSQLKAAMDRFVIAQEKGGSVLSWKGTYKKYSVKFIVGTETLAEIEIPENANIQVDELQPATV